MIKHFTHVSNGVEKKTKTPEKELTIKETNFFQVNNNSNNVGGIQSLNKQTITTTATTLARTQTTFY